jgi:hypothetical protein
MLDQKVPVVAGRAAHCRRGRGGGRTRAWCVDESKKNSQPGIAMTIFLNSWNGHTYKSLTINSPYDHNIVWHILIISPIVVWLEIRLYFFYFTTKAISDNKYHYKQLMLYEFCLWLNLISTEMQFKQNKKACYSLVLWETTSLYIRASLGNLFFHGIFIFPREISSFSLGQIWIPWENRVPKLALIVENYNSEIILHNHLNSLRFSKIV